MQLDSQNAVVPLLRATLRQDPGAAPEGPASADQIIAAIRSGPEGEEGLGRLAVGTAVAAGIVTEEWASARGRSVDDFLKLLPRHAPPGAEHVPEIVQALFDPGPRPFFVVMGDLVREGRVGFHELILTLAEYAAGLMTDLERDGVRTADECLAEVEAALSDWAARD
ncbi:hypothetical protein GCM10010402_38840 [Actinomadura luteofluorescens]|uniref:hypothetical protein n=1 Tax=Actinomadura luteofluorescens TaxID=46163 RepID=UPI00216400BC|nr:hypothetical protein [Actinomadura glauciflava]MCR3740238.1 hypothetical protein [Actinomadura glauciflava]